MTIGDRIKNTREGMQVTQEELAKHINSTKQTIYKYENNIVTNIPSDKIEKIAEFLGVTPAYLFGWTDNKNNKVKFISPLYKALEKLDLKNDDLTDREIKSIVDYVKFMKSNK